MKRLPRGAVVTARYAMTGASRGGGRISWLLLLVLGSALGRPTPAAFAAILSWPLPIQVSNEPGNQPPNPMYSGYPSLAVNGNSDAVVGWALTNPNPPPQTASTSLYAARRQGGAWQTPQLVWTPNRTLIPPESICTLEAAQEGGQGTHLEQVAIDPAGDAVLVWAKGHDGLTVACVVNDVVTASRLPAGGSWQTPQELSLSKYALYPTEVQVAFDSEQGAAGYTAHVVFLDGENNATSGTDYCLEISLLAADGTSDFNSSAFCQGPKALFLGNFVGSYIPPQNLAIAVAPNGETTAVWEQTASGTLPGGLLASTITPTIPRNE